MVEYMGKHSDRRPLASSVCPSWRVTLQRAFLPVAASLATACLATLWSAAPALAFGEQPFGVHASDSATPELAARSSDPVKGLGAFVLDDAQRARVARLIDEISDLDAAELDAAAQQTDGAASADLVLAVLLRAGRPTPPGLSTARRAQRAERSDEALAWLRVALAHPTRSAIVSDAVSSALNVASPAPELSVAAMRVVSQLDLVEHSVEVAQWLDPATPVQNERMCLSAKAALFQIYGRWFDDQAAFRAQWDLLRGRSPEATGRNELLSAIGTANSHALKLIEFAPKGLGHGPLDWPSAQMRSDAARAVGRAVAAGSMLPDDARLVLMSGLKEERSEGALAARLQTLLDLVQGADPSGEAATAVRSLVFELGELAKSRSCEEIWVMIGALTQLGHPYGVEGDEPRGATVALAVQLFERALRRGEVRALDPDALQSAMTSMSGVVRSIQDDAYATKVARPFAELVRPMVVGVSGAARRGAMPLRVRRAAADAFALSVKPSDATDLVLLVRSMDTPELEYELLGALRAVIAVLEPGSKAAETVIHELFATVTDLKFDSRSRALELLLSEDVRPSLLAVQRTEESQRVEARLLTEPAAELQVRLAHLLGLVGDADSLERLLAPDPDADPSTGSASSTLAQLAATNEELIAAAVDAARSLSASNPSARIRAALCIAGPESRLAEPASDTASLVSLARRPLRLRAGLDLMLEVDFSGSEPGQAIGAAERAAALAWIFPTALELRNAQPAQMATLFAGADDAARALQALVAAQGATLNAASSASGPGPQAHELVRALMTSDKMRAEAAFGLQSTDEQSQALQLAGVMDVFNRVLSETALLGPFHGWTQSAISIEAIDLLFALEKTEAAVQRLERLLDPVEPVLPIADEFGSETTPATPQVTSLASPRMIRLYAKLVLSADPFTGLATSRASRAAFHLAELIQRSSWVNEPADARLVDLEVALQVSTMLRPTDTRGPVLSAAISQATADPLVREELSAVERERAAAVWKKADGEDGEDGDV